MPLPVARLAIISIFLAFALAGCGSDSATTSPSQPQGEGTEEPADEVAHRRTKEPRIVVPDGPPPRKLVIRNLIEGDGVAAQRGDEVQVQYVAVDFQTKERFDSSWEQGWDPYLYEVGEPGLIAAWSKGVEGMKVGGRRELVIPPKWGFGTKAEGQSPLAGKTLIFMIDLLAVK